MVTRRSFWKLALLVICVILGGTLLACEPQDSGPKAWIDHPIDGARVSVGTPVSVISHVFVNEGVGEVLLSVDGKPFKRGTPSPLSASLSEITQQWVPPKAGEYVLQVRAYDANGEASNPATIKVRVMEEPTLEVTDTPTIALVPPPVVVVPTDEGPTPTWTSPPPLVPEVPLVLPPISTIEPIPPSHPDALWPPAEISFWADRPSVDQKQPCTTLHWEVEYATAVLFEDYAVAGHGSQVVCPKEKRTFTLRVEAPQGGGDRQITIQVSVPAQPAQPVQPVQPVQPDQTAQIKFWADQTSIEQKSCTTLHWDVEHATAVRLDGDGVGGHDSKKVCPNETRTYTLKVEAQQGGGDRQVTIQVSIPAQPPPPNKPKKLGPVFQVDPVK